MSVPLQNAGRNTLKNMIKAGCLTSFITTTFSGYIIYNIEKTNKFLPNHKIETKEYIKAIAEFTLYGFVAGSIIGVNHGRLSGSVINPIIGGYIATYMYNGLSGVNKLKNLTHEYDSNRRQQ